MKLPIIRILSYIILVIAIGIYALPIMWIFLTSLKTRAEVVLLPPKFIFTPHFENYLNVLFQPGINFLQALLNSLTVSLSVTAIALILGFLAAYTIARYRTGGKTYAFWILSMRIVPPIVIIPPMYILFATLKLIDTIPGLVILYLTFNTPIVVWIMKSYIEELPYEIEEQARVDGASTLTIIRKITLPLCAPGLVAVAILTFIFSWNEFIFALVFTDLKAATVTRTAEKFVTLYGTMWENMAASAILSMLPMLVFAFIIQKWLVRGLTMGAVKA